MKQNIKKYTDFELNESKYIEDFLDKLKEMMNRSEKEGYKYLGFN